jgi:phenylacetate-CoA ligase
MDPLAPVDAGRAANMIRTAAPDAASLTVPHRSLNARTVRMGAYRLVCRLRRDRHLAILEGLRATERWTPAEVRANQEARLAALLRHAWEHVPYYREPLEASGVVRPGAPPCIDLTRFGRLPLLTRDAIRGRSRDLEDRRPPERGNPRTTTDSGGTTGEPVRVVRDWASYQHAVAVQLWFDDWAGHAQGEPRVLIAGSSPTRWWHARRRLADWLRHDTRLSSGVLSDTVLDAYIDRINAVRPRQVVGLAMAVFRVARRAEATGRRIVPPGSVLVTAEPCLPEMREVIRRAFQAPVIDRYGASETGGIACQCRCEGALHVAAPAMWVEVLDPDGHACAPGEVGEIVVTRLTATAMPLIRYRLGDLGALDPDGAGCPCGRPFPTLRAVVGRVLDAFVRADGSLVSGFYVRRFYHRVPWIERFQVIQLDRRRIHVKLVDRERRPDPLAAWREDLARVASHLSGAIGAPCDVSFEFLDEIPAAPSGKYRATLSLVDRGPAGDPA